MPVEKITAEQFTTQLNNNIQEINPGHDVEIGPIPDLIVRPSAEVFENQNDRIRTVSQLILLDQSATFEDEDADNFVFNEFLIRNEGGRSSTVLVFSRATPPPTNITVQVNFPVSTSPDEETGETVIFVTTESKTLPTLTASSFFNLNTNRYELEVTAQAVVPGTIGEVGPNRINRPLRPLVGFDSVTNRNRSSTVIDREVNNALIERYKIAIRGTQISTRSGKELFVKANFSDAGDVLVVNSGNEFITRSGENGNAVDIFISGSQGIVRIENQDYVNVNQLIILDNQPVLSIINVSGFILDTDYEFVKDTSGVSNSVRSQDGIKFIIGGSLPTVGSTINVEYEQNILIGNIQSSFTDPDNDVGGQDILVRSGDQVNITISGQLIVQTGFSFTIIATAVRNSIINFINSLGLGDDVEESDLQKEIRSVSGVDNFIFNILDRVGGTGNADIIIELNEFARIDTANITIS